LILPIYWFTWWAARSAFFLFWRYRVLGAENLPRRGPFILAANHRSNADPALLGCTPWRRNFFFAKRELFEHRLFGWYISALGAFPVDRGGADLAAMRYAQQVLKEGHVLIFFPEGTRSKSGDFLPAQPGLGMIALRARVPVIPAYVHNSVEALRRKIPRRPVRTRIGRPIDPAALNLAPGRAGYQEFADLVLDRIKELAATFA
jgi:1-acyl-sn-glycerol-3-phosphate acyltransferase